MLRLDLAGHVDCDGALTAGWPRDVVPAGVRVLVDIGAAARLTVEARSRLAAATVVAREIEVVGEDARGVADVVTALSGALRGVELGRWPYLGPQWARRATADLDETRSAS
ncbi:MAG: hypothetical protein GEV10_06405 [Streptosporangiales bacterium]|nr:hypothetical protein [Streptosporangiales bacterium]